MYELYCKFRDKKGYKDADIAKATGIAKATLSDWKNNKSKPSTDKLLKIANVLDTCVEYLAKPEGNIITCPECGLTYDISFSDDVKEHNETHLLWEKANEKFGDLFCNNSINEKVKAKNRNIVNDLSKPIDERCKAQKIVFKCLFSRSLSACNYNDKHVDFNTYISMLLNQECFKRQLPNEIYDEFIKEYGKQKGIPNGETYYYPYSTEKPITIAAHFDGDEYTEDELDKIKEFAEFVKSNRK